MVKGMSPYNHMSAIRALQSTTKRRPVVSSGRRRRRSGRPKRLFGSDNNNNDKENTKKANSGPKSKRDWTPGRIARKTRGPLRVQQQPHRPEPRPGKSAVRAVATNAPVDTVVLRAPTQNAPSKITPQWIAVKRNPMPTLALQYAASGVVRILSIELTGLEHCGATELCDTIYSQCDMYFSGVPRSQVRRLIQAARAYD